MNELVWSTTRPVKSGWYWADVPGSREPAAVRVMAMPEGRLTIVQQTLDQSQLAYFNLSMVIRWAGPLELPAPRSTAE